MTRPNIYFDHAAATPTCVEALEAFSQTSSFYGNPGALHKDAVMAKQAVNDSRARIARCIGATPREIIAVSGATEANNLVILGRAHSILRSKGTLEGTHWITSSIEHDAILQPLTEIERLGGTVTHVDPDKYGIISPESIALVLRPATVLVTVGWANSEIGVVQSLSQMARTIRSYEKEQGSSIVFHSDAGQAPLYEKTTVRTLGVDALVLDSGKLYGPRGTGVLVMRPGLPIVPILFGGKQEFGIRPGTENGSLMAAFATAYEVISSERDGEVKRLEELRDALWAQISRDIPTVVRNGTRSLLPHILNISIPDVQCEYFVLSLDVAGFSVSTKSACREGASTQSHVVAALGDCEHGESDHVLLAEDRASHTIRFSLGRGTSREDIDRCARVCADIYARMRTQARE